MRGVPLIIFLSALMTLADGLRGQALADQSVQGVVTLVDSQRNLLVIQNGDHAQALKIEGALLQIPFGERVRVEGQLGPYFPAFPDFPSRPDGQITLPAFEAPTDWADHFIARLRGFVRAPAEGDYTFWISADEEGQLFFGTNSDPASACLIATSPRGLWPPTWDHDPEQKSSPIHLQAGERYYIEARQRDWRGHDNLGVAWQNGSFEREIIGGKFLSPWPAGTGATNGILYEYWTNCFITRLAALEPEAEEPGMIAASGARIESLGPGLLPEARKVALSGERLDAPNFVWVEIEGTVNFAAVEDGILTLEVRPSKGRNGTAGAGAQIRVLNWGKRPVAELTNRKVRACGVLEQALDVQGAPAGGILWLQDRHQLSLLDFAESDVHGLEATPMYEITPDNLNLAWGRKVVVLGTVMNYDPKTGRVLLRGDDSFHAFHSTDGTTWNPFGTPVPATMKDSILVGLAASSITTTQATEAKFSQVGLDLSSTKTAEIGGGPVAGSVTVSNHTASLRPTAGNDWAVNDEGLFVCQPLNSEGDIVTRIDSFQTTRISDKAGLMMRGSLDGEAPYVALVVTHGTRLDLLYRQSRGGVAKAVQRVGSELPCWVSLVRRRHTLVAQMMNGETLSNREPVELVGRLSWTNGEPMLMDAYARPEEKTAETVPPEGMPLEAQIADLPATAAKSDQYLNRDYLLRGVVTFKGRAFGRDLLFLQDESGAAALRASPSIFNSERIEPGQLLEVRGGVLFSPGVAPFRVATVTAFGMGVLPRAIPYPARSAERQADNHWVQADGIVRYATNQIMSVMGQDGPIQVWVGDLDSVKLARYVDCRVSLRGAFSLQAGPGPAMLVPSPRFIEITEPAPKDPFIVPSHSISEISSSDVNLGRLHRIKITGAVTYRDQAMLVVQDQNGGARVFGSVPPEVRVGDQVEAVGFPNLEGSVVTLRESVVRTVGNGHSPEPPEITVEALLSGQLNCWLVRMEGIVLNQKSRQGRQILELQSGQRVFEAVLPEGAKPVEPLPTGTRVQVTGVTQLQLAGLSTKSATGRDYPLVATMNILMRTPDDLLILQRPPWWNWRRAAVAGALLVALLAGAFGWIHSLRQRVAKRTSELEDAMSRLQKETELSATLAERERLAAEIHDTLEQGLSGIMMQLDGAGTRLGNDTSGARENLELARRMVQFSRAEVRHSLWNLESQLLKDGDLGGAIKEIARQMSPGSSTTVSVEVSDARFDLPASIAHHLLRCTQEAISNALKHAGARQIRVKLSYRADQVEVEIADDGRGFDSSQVLTGPGTHLGLRNLRSRARKMKGRLDFASEPHKGTTVRLTVPMNGRNGNTSETSQ